MVVFKDIAVLQFAVSQFFIRLFAVGDIDQRQKPLKGSAIGGEAGPDVQPHRDHPVHVVPEPEFTVSSGPPGGGRLELRFIDAPIFLDDQLGKGIAH